MMSSLASVFVAKAKATPEKVVPWSRVSDVKRDDLSGGNVQNQYRRSIEPCCDHRLRLRRDEQGHTDLPCVAYLAEEPWVVGRRHRHNQEAAVDQAVELGRRNHARYRWGEDDEPFDFDQAGA